MKKIVFYYASEHSASFIKKTPTKNIYGLGLTPRPFTDMSVKSRVFFTPSLSIMTSNLTLVNQHRLH